MIEVAVETLDRVIALDPGPEAPREAVAIFLQHAAAQLDNPQAILSLMHEEAVQELWRVCPAAPCYAPAGSDLEWRLDALLHAMSTLRRVYWSGVDKFPLTRPTWQMHSLRHALVKNAEKARSFLSHLLERRAEVVA